MLPRVIVHNAASLDGRITGFSVDNGLYYELASAWNAEAMLSGSTAALAASTAYLPDPGSNPGVTLPTSVFSPASPPLLSAPK